MALFSSAATTRSGKPALSESCSSRKQPPQSLFEEASINRTTHTPRRYRYHPQSESEAIELCVEEEQEDIQDDLESDKENQPHATCPAQEGLVLTNPWLHNTTIHTPIRVESLCEPSTPSSSPYGKPSLLRSELSYCDSVTSLVSATSSNCVLYGEALLSSDGGGSVQGTEIPNPGTRRRVMDDIEAQQPHDATAATTTTTAAADSYYHQLSQFLRPHLQQLHQTSLYTQEQLRAIARHVTCNTSKVLLQRPMQPTRPILEPWDDLQQLQLTHKDKMNALLQQQQHEDDDDDSYDFCLVLTPLQLYAFWALHLDFRPEVLGTLQDETINNMTLPTNTETQSQDEEDDQQQQDDDEEDSEHNHTLFIDARPFLTPMGMRRRKLSSPAVTTVSELTIKDDGTNTLPASIIYNNINNNNNNNNNMAPIQEETPSTSKPSLYLNTTMDWSGRKTSRLSLFERAVYLTPTSLSTRNLETTPRSSVMSVRRRWGNRHSTTLTSPPIIRTTRHSMEAVDAETKLYSTSTVPRGIAARSHGMLQFLSALQRGIVLRRHKPGREAILVKLVSNDGGDTIRLETILDPQEALLAFREQRLRYNRTKRNISSAPWSLHTNNNNHHHQDDTLPHGNVPDYVAAEHYQKTFKPRNILPLSTTTIRTHDVIAVHPGRHADPRVAGELGTASLRKSQSDYDVQHTFSVVTKNPRLPLAKKTAVSEKWYSGEGTEAQFKSIDLEAATEGEYWLVFRGFLLLHRDAATGRFAKDRAAGFGSNYRDPDANALQKDVYSEPRTISRWAKWVAHMRSMDLTLELYGAAAPGAVPPPSDYFLGFKSPGTQIWSRLRQAGLETTRIYGIDTRRVMIKLKCPPDRLTDVAEVLRIKLLTRDGSFAPFRENAFHTFQPLNDELDAPKSILEAASLFRSSDRQKVIDFIIRSRIRDSGAELGQNTDLGKMIQARVPLHMHKKLDSLFNAWFYFWRRENWIHRDGRSMAVMGESMRLHLTSPVHRVPPSPYQEQKATPGFLFRFFVGSFYQPLDSIEQYFGEKIAFYFAWLQHCSRYLVFLSVAGFIVFLCQITSGNWDHPIRPFFALVIMLWSFSVLVNWRQRQNFLAYRWGTMDHKVQETTRPQFKGEYRRDEITGEWVVYYPKWKRYLKYLISFPIALAFTIGTLVLILLVHANRDQLLARYYDQKTSPGEDEFHLDFSVSAIGRTKPINSVELNGDHLRDPQFWFIVAGLPFLLGLFLPLLNFILMRISMMLTDFENYRTESEYRSALIIKVFSFRFVCYFATLYYYCFLSVGNEQAVENGILRVGSGVFIYITVTNWWGTFVQTYFPLLIYHIRRRRQQKRLHEELMQVEREEAELEDLDEDEANNDDIKAKKIHLVNKRLLLDQAQDDLWQEVMLPQHDSFPEYIQAIVQFAYVTCFSVVLPVTPLICLMNHLISMRSDAYKLCKTRQRPLAQKTGGIGVWEHVLHIVTVIAVLTNCWLMGFTTAQFTWIAEKVGQLGLFAIVVGWEHVMLLIKYVIQTSTPKLPKSVRDEMKKEQYALERKRNSSMRAKKDRRSKSGRLFFSPTAFDGETPTSEAGTSIADKRPESVMRNLAGSNRPHGLMTIPSEDVSDGTPSTSQSKLTEAGSIRRDRDSRSKEAFQPTKNEIVRSKDSSKVTSSTDSHELRVPTPCHLGMPLEAEAAEVDRPARVASANRILHDQFSTVDATLLPNTGSQGIEIGIRTSVGSSVTGLSDDDPAGALAAARIEAKLDKSQVSKRRVRHAHFRPGDLFEA
jgi:hypothetical protein